MQIVFRKFKTGEIIALFCGTAKYCNPGMVESYMHLGQHGEATADLGRTLRLATPEEYAPLKRELEKRYECAIVPVSRLSR